MNLIMLNNGLMARVNKVGMIMQVSIIQKSNPFYINITLDYIKFTKLLDLLNASPDSFALLQKNAVDLVESGLAGSLNLVFDGIAGLKEKKLRNAFKLIFARWRSQPIKNRA